MNNRYDPDIITKEEYITVIYALNDCSKRMFDAYNEVIKTLNLIDNLCVDNNGYDLINIICRLGLFTDIGELLASLDKLQEIYELTYEQGVYLNQMKLLDFNDLNNIKEAMNSINEIDVDNLQSMYNYMVEQAKNIEAIIPKRKCPNCCAEQKLKVETTDSINYYVCENCDYKFPVINFCPSCKSYDYIFDDGERCFVCKNCGYKESISK